MKIDARKLSNSQVVESDVCVIGAGPAGTTLTREFLGTSISVSLLESGGDKAEEQIYDLSKGELSGELYEVLESTHLRQVGGTANNWILQMTDDQYGYRYTPFEEIDFEARDGIPHSGWPIKKKDLDPYYARVHDVCEIGPYDYSAAFGKTDKHQPLPLPEGKAINGIFHFGPTKKFTNDFPSQFVESSNITLYTHSTVIELIVSEDGKTVEKALVRTFNGNEIYFKAKQFIIAANALQTPRLLLNSKSLHHPQGIGNQYDNVGRYYMDHNLVPLGNFVPHDPKLINKMGFYDMQNVHGVTVLGKIMLAPEIMREQKLSNIVFMLFPMAWSQADMDAMNSAAELKFMFMFSIKRLPFAILKHIPNLWKGKKRLTRAIYEYFRYGVPILLGLGRGGWSRIENNEKKYGSLELLTLVEQTPNPNNRVTLIEDNDQLGCPRIKVHYIFSDKDLESVACAQKIIGEALEETGLGSYQPPKKPMDSIRKLTGAHHMMGTARMSDSPERGVVDKDCKVFGVDNLYVAGSATFTTGSYVNPTLTNLALSIRVADKVKETLGMRA